MNVAQVKVQSPTKMLVVVLILLKVSENVSKENACRYLLGHAFKNV